MAGFDASSDDAYLQRLYTPQLRRAGDLRTAGALWAPSRLLLHNAPSTLVSGFVAGAYSAADAPKKLRIVDGEASADAIAAWVTAR